MNGTTSPQQTRGYHLIITRYERVASLLISLLIMIGTLVLILFIAWLTSQIFVNNAAVPVELSDFPGDDGPVGGGQTPEPPNPEEIREMEVEEPVITEQLTNITAVVQKQVPLLDDPMIAHKKTSGEGFGHGEGRGRGDGKGDGTGGSSLGWEVRFDKGNTLDVYARQLDFFHIELATLLPDGSLAYARNFSKPRPEVRIVKNPSESEKRVYLSWRKGELQDADRALLAKAGINAKGFIIKFLPKALKDRLEALEMASAGGRKRQQIRRTLFGVRSDGDGYAFFVIDQNYKN